ncbi:SAM-dependent methyltransferase [Clostridium tetanomorphum]|uniref:Methyltransferase domain-containing protein n=2 Tax=Clostridium tetanomorphum TaxID=1553 RepID=A0A923E5E0_CLOTT|nr:methyltransferase domain-containing protein [Clostridium tetanomorphum]MBC2396782.1 methyltransferase domain-containing protein [Clostridium tetanomorphum]NRZ97581.1 cyclopropane fatty-acyl-phospholipid synthase-like methyltransferase [Clostridium tetanomorphum]
MEFLKSSKYDNQFVKENMMGPNALKMIEELTVNLNLQPGMKVLDLGCGKGLTSIFLAKEFGVQVYATDLWIGATENFQRFKDFGLEEMIIPIHADANDLPFANEYFDAVISVDSYYYFGREDGFMDKKLAPFVKSNGIIAMSFPGFKEEIHNNLPKEILLSWRAEDMETFHSCEWWQQLLSKSKKITVEAIDEMMCFEECWKDWLNCENEYAVNDRRAMEAGAGKYMNIISVIARKRR